MIIYAASQSFMYGCFKIQMTSTSPQISLLH